MATETKTTTENEIQPRGKLVNKIQIRRNYPKHNTEKQMLGKCDSKLTLIEMIKKKVKSIFIKNPGGKKPFQEEFQKENEIKALCQGSFLELFKDSKLQIQLDNLHDT